MLNLLRKSAARKEFAMRLESQLAARARDPFFFRVLNVPDTVDGRFDMVALHGWLVLERLKAARMEEAAQVLTDILFVGFDEALREQGTGDMGMGRRMKAFANAFFGRLHAYSGAQDETALAEALAKNIWRGKQAGDHGFVLARYVASARTHLAAADIADGKLDFGPLPDGGGV
ncbi:MAG TPA: ubiquinol-cytochrome C chaperone family protein [Rhizomicrobium sp.]|jgi:cytochrome b pre-mRNA-processing protein 3|nr:ubiquinol-cytochrome C chaperone family protein [Rhizomicrobium sp.]